MPELQDMTPMDVLGAVIVHQLQGSIFVVLQVPGNAETYTYMVASINMDKPDNTGHYYANVRQYENPQDAQEHCKALGHGAAEREWEDVISIRLLDERPGFIWG